MCAEETLLWTDHLRILQYISCQQSQRSTSRPELQPHGWTTESINSSPWPVIKIENGLFNFRHKSHHRTWPKPTWVLPEVRENSQFEQRSWQCLDSCHNSSSENNYKSQIDDAYKVPVRTHQVRYCAFSACYFCTQRAIISQPSECSFFYIETKTFQLLVKKHSVPYICLPKDSENPGEMQQLIFTNLPGGVFPCWAQKERGRRLRGQLPQARI